MKSSLLTLILIGFQSISSINALSRQGHAQPIASFTNECVNKVDLYTGRLTTSARKALHGGMVCGRSKLEARGLIKPSTADISRIQQPMTTVTKSMPAYPIIAASTSLLHGYDTGVIAGALLFFPLALNIKERPDLIGMVLTSSTLGAIAGSSFAPNYLKKHGRVQTLRVCGLIFLLSSIISSSSVTFQQLLVGRTLTGVAMGLSSASVPLYISECSPALERGRFATLPQLAISGGILVSYVMCFLVLMIFGGNWRIMLGVSSIPSILQLFATSYGLLESPRWLVSKGRFAEARDNLKQLRKDVDLKLIENEFKEMIAANDLIVKKNSAVNNNSSSSSNKKKDDTTLLNLLQSPQSRKMLFVCLALQMFQQLSGINAIVYFTPSILKEAGVPALLKKVGILDPNAAGLLSTIFAYLPKMPALLLAMKLMDKMGRRSLLLTFVPIMSSALLSLAMCFRFMSATNPMRGMIAIISIMTFGISFVLSIGPIPSILSSELFPTNHRASGMSASVSAQWGFNALVSFMFPILQYKYGTQFVLSFFATASIIGWFFTYLFVPETKGKSLEELGKGV